VRPAATPIFVTLGQARGPASLFQISNAGRQEEIARILSGAEVTPEASAQADRLLEGV